MEVLNKIFVAQIFKKLLIPWVHDAVVLLFSHTLLEKALCDKLWLLKQSLCV